MDDFYHSFLADYVNAGVNPYAIMNHCMSMYANIVATNRLRLKRFILNEDRRISSSELSNTRAENGEMK
jgi:hypothetical protein